MVLLLGVFVWIDDFFRKLVLSMKSSRLSLASIVGLRASCLDVDLFFSLNPVPRLFKDCSPYLNLVKFTLTFRELKGVELNVKLISL